jgi:hypothetical protein
MPGAATCRRDASARGAGNTPLRAALPAIELTLLVGSYAIYDYLPHSRRHSMTETVGRWREFLPEYFVLPHPSWHTIRWLRDNPWFENEALPELRSRIGSVPEPKALDCMPPCAPAEEPDPAAELIPRR